MKKLFSIIFSVSAAAVLLLCASCAKEEGVTAVPGSIVFSQEGLGVSVVRTKADVVDELPSFGVVATTGEAGSEAAAWDPAKVTFSLMDGTSYYEGGKMWPDADPGYHFYASNADLVFAAEGCAVATDGTTDVVCAYLATPTYNKTNKLTFEHIYARIGSFTLTPKEGFTVDKVVAKISCPTGGSYNLRTGAGKTDGTGWTAGQAQEFTLNNGENDIYVLPGTDYLLTVEYEITNTATGEITYFKGTGARKAHIALTAGYVNNISGTADEEGGVTSIRFTVEVKQWGEKTVAFDWD